MALLKPGWFQTTWFPSCMWQEDYWPEYGIGAPSGTSGMSRWPNLRFPTAPKPLLNPELAAALKDYLDLKVGENS